MSRSNYHPLDIRAERLTAAEAAEIEIAYDQRRGPGRQPLHDRPAGPFAANLTAAILVLNLDIGALAGRLGDTVRRLNRLAQGDTLPHYYADILPLARELETDPAHLAFEPSPAFRKRLLARVAA